MAAGSCPSWGRRLGKGVDMLHPPLWCGPWSPGAIRVGRIWLPCRGKSPRGGGQELYARPTVTTAPPSAQTRRDLQSWPVGGRGRDAVGLASWGQVGGRTFPALLLPHPPALRTGCHPEHCRKRWLQQQAPHISGRGQGGGTGTRWGSLTRRREQRQQQSRERPAPQQPHGSLIPPGPGAAAASGAGRAGAGTGVGRRRLRSRGGGAGPGGGRGAVGAAGTAPGLSALRPRPSRRGGGAGLRAERRAREPRARPPLSRRPPAPPAPQGPGRHRGRTKEAPPRGPSPHLRGLSSGAGRRRSATSSRSPSSATSA